jgi:hypothetical protein
MARKKVQMQKLIDLRERLQGNIAQHQKAMEALQNQLLGVEASIRALSTDGNAAAPKSRNVKRTVMELVNEAGKLGVTAAEIVERAFAKGRTLERPSVSSLLSRFKREGALTFDGERYFPATIVSPPESPLKIVKTANGA